MTLAKDITVDEYPMGSVLKLKTMFKSGPSLVDPTTVTLKYKHDVDKTWTTLTWPGVGTLIVHEAAGIFSWTLDTSATLTKTGLYIYKWESTGTGKASHPDGKFIVLDSAFYTGA